MEIDLNCDMGESFGAYKLGLDEEVIRYITSANIACGWAARSGYSLSDPRRDRFPLLSAGRHAGLWLHPNDSEPL